MKDKILLFIDLPHCESTILGLMGHYREAFTHGYSVQQVSPFFVSGVVQGMMLMLEEQLRYSGMEPEMYWESERGKQLCKNLSDFKEYCRMYWLRQPQYVEELN